MVVKIIQYIKLQQHDPLNIQMYGFRYTVFSYSPHAAHTLSTASCVTALCFFTLHFTRHVHFAVLKNECLLLQKALQSATHCSALLWCILYLMCNPLLHPDPWSAALLPCIVLTEEQIYVKLGLSLNWSFQDESCRPICVQEQGAALGCTVISVTHVS